VRRNGFVPLWLFAVIFSLSLPLGEAKANTGVQRWSGQYLVGLIASQRGDYPTAAETLLAVALAEDAPSLLKSLALGAAISDGRMDEAVELAKTLDARGDASGTALLMLAAAEAKDGRWEAAEATLRKLDPNSVIAAELLLVTGWTQLGAGNLDGALDTIGQLGQQRGLRSLFLMHKALMLEVAGKNEEAKAAYDEAIADSGQLSSRLVVLAASFYSRQGDTEAATAVLQKALAQRPQELLIQEALVKVQAGETLDPEVASAAGGLAEVYLQIGSALIGEGPQELALRDVRFALFLRPGLVSGQILLGRIFEQMAQYDLAIAAYRAVGGEGSRAVSAEFAQASVLAAAERIDEAVALFERLAAERPDDPSPLIEMGNTLRWQRRFEESLDAYNRAIARIDADEPGFWFLYYSRGISHERLDDWPAAETDFQKALELNPDQPQVLNYLGYSWVDRGEHLEKALEMLKKAVEQRPNDGYIVDSLGWAEYRLGDFEAAVETLERAVELDPGQAVINDHLGDAYWRVGRKREARVQWQRALSLGDDPDLDPEAVQRKLDDGLPALTAEVPAEPAAAE